MAESKKRKHNPEWKDTPAQKAERQRRHYERMKEYAAGHGFTSWAALVTALLNGEVTIKKHPQD